MLHLLIIVDARRNKELYFVDVLQIMLSHLQRNNRLGSHDGRQKIRHQVTELNDTNTKHSTIKRDSIYNKQQITDSICQVSCDILRQTLCRLRRKRGHGTDMKSGGRGEGTHCQSPNSVSNDCCTISDSIQIYKVEKQNIKRIHCISKWRIK